MELYDPSAAPKVTDINTVPSDFRFMYKQSADGFELDGENPSVKSSLSIITSLKSALTRSRNDFNTANKNKVDLSPLSDYGQTPAEIQQNFATKVEELMGQIKGVDPKKIEEGVAKQFTPKLEAEQRKNKTLTDQLYSMLVTGESISAVADAKGIPELLMPFIQTQVKVIEQEGKFFAHVVDGNGETRYSGTKPMTIKELVTEMKGNVKYGRLFESEAPQGTGSKPGAAHRMPNSPAPVGAGVVTDKSPTNKIRDGLNAGHATKPR